MAVDARAVSVGTTATRLDTQNETDDVSASAVAVYNNGAETIYLGDVEVTTATGYPLAAGEHMSVRLDSPRDSLYGIVAAATEEARVLEVGV